MELNFQFYSPYPDIYDFMEVLNDVQSDFRIKTRKYNIIKSHKKNIPVNKKIVDNRIEIHDSGKISVLQWVQILTEK